MIASIVTGGLLGQGLATGGLIQGVPVAFVNINTDPYSTTGIIDAGSLNLDPRSTTAVADAGALNLDPFSTKSVPTH